MKIVGIDPGKSGALALVESSTLQCEDVLLMPYDGKELNVLEVSQFLSKADAVVLERQQAMPAQGRGSIFTLGSAYGALRATVALSGKKYMTALPTKWTRIVLEGVPGEGKARNITAAKRLFPELDLTPGRRTKPHDGIADAALLAFYGCRVFGGVG